MAGSQNDASEEFTSFYLQQATKEFAEDLDKQGTALFSSADQRRIMDAAQKQPEEGSHEDTSSSGSSISDEGK
ncbi:hypothetical protein BKA67DRAFT_660847 [Truncatella angustata]|uniref:Uncharacterized protein n=1 Tax=Truncatella angustata TaxID=152316 RepID=A0A9P8ZUX7_9PEZI|nr:uncharacterized protein BKA67DRAFT_660847 [Truncatella angustata]KAH6652079.1 hypothetical protein BKA67DRAFT_660847 [Truncatella angustata]